MTENIALESCIDIKLCVCRESLLWYSVAIAIFSGVIISMMQSVAITIVTEPSVYFSPCVTRCLIFIQKS